MTLKISNFSLENVNIAWNNLVHLDLECTSLDEVLRVIRDAPLLEICTLCDIFAAAADGFPTPGTTIRNPRVRTLEVSSMEPEVLTELINSLELPSLGSWELSSDAEDEMPVDTMISFLKRSACGLKTLRLWYDMEDQDDVAVPAIEDFERFPQPLPHLQQYQFHILNVPDRSVFILR